MIPKSPQPDFIARRADALLEDQARATCRLVDRLFLLLIPIQFAGGIALSLWVSPKSWAGLSSHVHPHVWAALLLGGFLSTLPLGLALLRPGQRLTRHAIAVSQMLTSALFIHLTGGRIETHFHVFGSLALLAFYLDWGVLGTATVVVAADHLLRGVYWPESVYGVSVSSPWRWIEHAGWVAFEDVVLIVAIAGHRRLMRQGAQRQATLEATNQDLRTSEERFRSLSTSSPVGIFMIDSNGGCLHANGRARAISGLDDHQCRGDGWIQAIHPDDRSRIRRELDALVRGREHFSEEYRLLRKGEVVWVHVRMSRLHSPAGLPTGFVGTMEDITDRKEAARALEESEERFRRAQKMEAIGRLAGGVAHDFNNLLTVINGYGDILLKDETNESRRKDLEEVCKAGQRASELTRQLLTFSRRQAVEPKVVDLNAVVRNVEKMIRRLIGEDIRFVTDLDPELARVKVDPGQMDQVIMNLAVNSRDAMPQGGTLSIRTAMVESNGVDTGKFVAFRVADTGCGMDREVLSRIFEPFFTTKGVGKGTGLGLCVVYAVVEQAKGRVDVQSEPGKGTTFTIYLPVVEGVRETARRELSRRMVRGGTETILLVEDEASVRLLARTALQSKGYRVIEAANGEEALGILNSRAHRIDLVVTDVIMPEVGGPELVRRLRAIFPVMKVVYMSGYSENALSEEGGIEEGGAVIEKPFRVETLAQQVRLALDRPTVQASAN